MTTVDDTPDRRAALIADIRALADWLEANPDVPINRFGRVELSYYPAHEAHLGTDDAAFGEVRRIADLIGGNLEQDADRICVTAPLLGRAGYSAIAHSADHMARYTAGTSYLYVVEPEPAGAR